MGEQWPRVVMEGTVMRCGVGRAAVGRGSARGSGGDSDAVRRG